jgi:hypothetical protein
MNIGMLWFDNDPKADLLVKIGRAADYYQGKYGQHPNLCFVHPNMVKETVKPAGIELRTSRTVLPNHFWIGVGTTAA